MKNPWLFSQVTVTHHLLTGTIFVLFHESTEATAELICTVTILEHYVS